MINAGDKPLALYVFTSNKADIVMNTYLGKPQFFYWPPSNSGHIFMEFFFGLKKKNFLSGRAT